MSKELNIYKVMRILEKEYINNHKYISSLSEKEKKVFTQTMKISCSKFDISVLTYMRLLERDKNSCAICGKSRKEVKGRLCLDHNHEFEDWHSLDDFEDDPVESYGGVFVRGFLCTTCNIMLGHVGDRCEILRKAIRYLKNFTPYNDILYYSNKKHKLLKSDRQKMYDEQNGRCKICGINEVQLRKELCTDHDHLTGQVRGLLCYHCNSLLGCCHDDITILRKAINYLKRGYDDVMFYHPEIMFIRGQLPPVEYMMYAYRCFGEGWEKKFLELDW